MRYDVTIIGAGIVGLATAYHLKKENADLNILVLEKESFAASHQTGHNSGVIHSGIYYKPGSLKATNCRKGYHQLLEFCKEHGIEHDICGKVIVAADEKEIPQLDMIHDRGVKNGLEGIKKISKEEIKEREPHCSGVKGIFVPQTGIVDYKEVALAYQRIFEADGGVIRFKEKVQNINISDEVAIVETTNNTYETELVVNCAGLYADKVAAMTGQELDFMILPFRGEYYDFISEKEHLVNHLIYPVPDPDFPFLGVHFTRMIHGVIEAGPNAVLAFAREGYDNKTVNAAELTETLGFSGFRKIAQKYYKKGWQELRRSYSKRLFTKELQRLIPDIQEKDLVKGNAGVRAMACDKKGNLIDDFLIREGNRVLNVCNAPSPAATASLSIGEMVKDKVLGKLTTLTDNKVFQEYKIKP